MTDKQWLKNWSVMFLIGSLLLGLSLLRLDQTPSCPAGTHTEQVFDRQVCMNVVTIPPLSNESPENKLVA